MAGLSPFLLKKLRRTLLGCATFDTHRALVSVFADSRIAPWKNQISQAEKNSDRVDFFISDFLNIKNRDGQSVLVLFLQALFDRAEEEDEGQQRLNDLAVEVAYALGSELPPLARNNLWRASAVSTGISTTNKLSGYTLSLDHYNSNLEVARLPPYLPTHIFAERLESLKNNAKADWLPVTFLEKGLQAARAVGRVEHQGRKIGTAFLVTPELILTSAHVIRDIPTLEEGGVRFNIGLQIEPQWRYFAALVAHSPIEELDFSLVRLSATTLGTPLKISTETAYATQHANILQHPLGDSMQVALRYNEVVYVDQTRLYYVSDTEDGSSGSPVFDDGWRVFAIHRAGIEDDAGHPVKNANQGVPLTAVEPIIRPYLNGG